MNTKDYISSGILETFVLGLCSENEAYQVLEFAAKYPEIQAEIERIEKDLISYSASASPEIHDSIKENILNEISDDTKVIPIAIVDNFNPDSGRLRFLIAASVALLVLSMAANFFLYRQWQGVSNQLSEVQSQSDLLAEQMQIQQAAYSTSQQELAVMMEPGMKSIMLKGMNPAPDAMAMVFYNETSKDVYFQVRSLPEPAADKQYQLWAIVDGVPVDAGVFDMDQSLSNMVKMKQIPNAKAFAVTLEKKGGSPVPTLEAMYLLGEV